MFNSYLTNIFNGVTSKKKQGRLSKGVNQSRNDNHTNDKHENQIKKMIFKQTKIQKD